MMADIVEELRAESHIATVAAKEITALRTRLAAMESATAGLQADRDSVRAQLAEARAQIKAAEEQEAVFWYRQRSGGGYEGPIHNSVIEEVRKTGGWLPLFTSQIPAPNEREIMARALEEAKKHFDEYADDFPGTSFCLQNMIINLRAETENESQ